MRCACLLIMVIGLVGPGHAGVVTREKLVELFPAPLIVGERYAALPVWPIFQSGATGPVLLAQAFETVDIEPVSGYGGKPLNLLVVVDRDGKFLDVRLLGHTEPIFMSPKGTATLNAFAEQYKSLSLNHSIQILSPKAQREQTDSTATLHGITAGTVTARAIDRSIMEAAAQVAQSRLDDPNARRSAAPARGPNDKYERSGWNALVTAHLVQNFTLTNREVEARFKGSAAAGGDAEGTLRPDSVAVDLWMSLLAFPQAGRNLLDATGWQRVRNLRESGIQVVLLFDNGRYALARAGGPQRSRSLGLTLLQGSKTIELKELDYEHDLLLGPRRSSLGANATPRFFQTTAGAGLDITQPFTVQLLPVRRMSDEVPIPASAAFAHRFGIEKVAAFLPVRETPMWLKVWEQRRIDLLILLIALLVLAAALTRQAWLSLKPDRLARFRIAYLGFTLVWLGWLAQGQLTIVNLTSLIEAVIGGRSTDFLLADPMAVVLWVFVGITLLVWGRGTFCGWLCPFGAFQELLSLVTKRLGLKPRQLHTRLDANLKRVKFAVLASIVGAACLSATWTSRLVEVEPFKSSISMNFQRDWPYVAWAVLCLTASVLVFRGYCRYVCPLGAALALLDRVRLPAWIPRRAECGTPCQTCRHRCEYQAITTSGTVDYAECFQCLDCVGIHQDAKRCMPLIREHKRRVIPLRPVPVTA